MPEVFLGIGSNIDPDRHIPVALSELQRRFGSMTVSSIYESEPVGFNGPSFHNLVAGFHTDLPVEAVATVLMEIEIAFGRNPDWKKFSARPIDIDLLLYGDRVRGDTKPILPREDITTRAYVLEPLAEIAPAHRHPVTGETFAELWARFDKAGLTQRRLENSETCQSAR